MSKAAPDQTRGVRIVALRDIVPLGRLGLSSFYYGLGLFVLIFCEMLTFVFLDKLGFPQLVQKNIALSVWGLTIVAGPVPGLFRGRIQMASARRRLVSTLSAAFGAVCVPWLTAVVFTAQLLFMADGELASLLKSIAGGVLGVATLVLIWTLLALAMWPLIMRIAPFKIQDGATCPQCGYCVRGVTSCICPECGRIFNRDDLGLSEAAFAELVSGSQMEPSAALT